LADSSFVKRLSCWLTVFLPNVLLLIFATEDIGVTSGAAFFQWVMDTTGEMHLTCLLCR
jgi:hypothetical protein